MEGITQRSSEVLPYSDSLPIPPVLYFFVSNSSPLCGFVGRKAQLEVVILVKTESLPKAF